METLKLPKNITLKVVIDYFQSNHNAHKGLTLVDHQRISSDLEKIVDMPLCLNNYSTHYNAAELIRINERTADLPVRYVKIVVGYKSGRLKGYKIVDEIDGISSYGNITIQESVQEWYSNPNMGGNPSRNAGKKYIDLKDLDEYIIKK